MKSTNEIFDYLQQNYSQFKDIKTIKLISHNNINSTNYLITTGTTQYVLRNFTDDSNYKKIEKICKILNFCTQNNIAVLQPIKNKNDRYVDKKNKVYVTKYHEGSAYKGRKTQLHDLAKTLAILHKTLRKNTFGYNYNSKSSYYKIIKIRELQHIKKIISRKNEKGKFDKIILAHMSHISKSIREYNKTEKIINQLVKKQLVHHDLHPRNVIFKKHIATIIDFNSMRKGYRIDDIAFASFRFALYNTNNENEIVNKIKLFVNNYMKYDDIEKEEITNFDHYIMRTILTRLSYIIKSRYFHNSNTWSIDLEKFLNFLILLNRLKTKIKSNVSNLVK